jgi:hypothetical protein
MAGPFSDYLENALLNQLFRGSSYCFPNLYVGLYTAAPTDAGGGTEVSGNSYARGRDGEHVQLGQSTAGATSNSNAITFPQASGSWGHCGRACIFDASTSGNLLAWADLTTSKLVSNGDTPSFAAGDLDVTLD